MNMPREYGSTGTQNSSARRVVRRLTLTVFVVVVLALPGAAYSGTAFNWISNVTVANGSSTGTSGYGSRDYIEASRSIGFCTQLSYEHTDNSYHFSSVNCTSDPFKWNTSDGYARSWCTNTDPYYWKFNYCQTT